MKKLQQEQTVTERRWISSQELDTMNRIAALMSGWKTFQKEYIEEIRDTNKDRNCGKIIAQINDAFINAVQTELESVKAEVERLKSII